MKIAQLTIQNVRAIASLTLDFMAPDGEPRRRLVLLGGNGSGKTTILTAIAHVIGQENKSFAAGLLGARDVRQDGRALQDLSAEPPKGSISMDAFLSREERERALSLERALSNIGDKTLPERMSLRAVIGSRTSLGLAALAARAAKRSPFDIHERLAAMIISAQNRPPAVFLPADRGVLDDTEQVSIASLNEFEPVAKCLSRSRERFQLIPSLLALAHAAPDSNDRDGTVALMWKVLEKYVPEMPRLAGVRGLRLLFETADGAIVDLGGLSDGQRAVLLILGELALRNPADGIVLIDEIEQHLHPRWQQAILEALSSLLPHAQFIITTQAPYIAASAPDDVITIGDWGRDGPQ